MIMKIRFLAYAVGALLSVAGLFYLRSTQQTGKQNHPGWETLTQSSLIHAKRLSHVFFFDKNNGITISPYSIERSVDGGKTWKEVPGSNGNYYSLVFIDNQNGWVVGSSENDKPLVMKTNDRGINWQKVNFDEKSLSALNEKISFFLAICFDRTGKGWIAGKGGIVEAITDGQNLRISSIFSTKETLYSVSCNGSGEVWAVGQDAVFHYQNDWRRKEIDKRYVFGKVVSNGSDVWLLGADSSLLENGSSGAGVLLRSRDNGQTWENKTPASANLLNDLYIKDGSGWLVGAEGSIYYTSDNGNSWTKSTSPTNSDLLHIFFLDSKNGWISGDKATVLKYQN
jgi:photosystem II stability/assembly factor-like uncharacterized protein